MTASVPTPAQVRDNYRRLLDRVAAAAPRAGRSSTDVRVVAVTKTASPDQVRLLVELGHRDFGDSRVQHLVQRVATLDEFLSRRRLLGSSSEFRVSSLEQNSQDQGPEGSPPGKVTPRKGPAPTRNPKPETRDSELIRWHLIGHLQRNKVKQVVPLVHLIHSIDSLRLAEELHAYGARTDRTIDVLMQVNTAGDPNKYGVAPAATLHLAEQIDTMVHLRFRGLMTIAPYAENPEDSRAVFAQTRELFEELRAAKIGGGACNLLSMGMSGDYEVAVQEGANLIRVGRLLFGEGAEPVDAPDRRMEEPGSEP